MLPSLLSYGRQSFWLLWVSARSQNSQERYQKGVEEQFLNILDIPAFIKKSSAGKVGRKGTECGEKGQNAIPETFLGKKHLPAEFPWRNFGAELASGGYTS